MCSRRVSARLHGQALRSWRRRLGRIAVERLSHIHLAASFGANSIDERGLEKRRERGLTIHLREAVVGAVLQCVRSR